MQEAFRAALQQKDNERALQASWILLGTKAFKTGKFVFNSGLKSPMKIDTDILREDPQGHKRISEYLTEAIQLTLPRDERPNVIVGVISGGVSFAQEVAELLGVRYAARLGNTDTPKKREQMYGWILEGDRVVVIEDVVTTGANTLACVRQVEEEGGITKLAVSVFNFNFEVAKQAFLERKLQHYALTNFFPLLHLLDDQSLVAELRNWHSRARHYFQELTTTS